MGNLRIASLVMAVGIWQRNVSISMPCVARSETLVGSKSMNFKELNRRPRMESVLFMHASPILLNTYI